MEDRSSIDPTTQAASNALVAAVGFYTRALEDAGAELAHLQARYDALHTHARKLTEQVKAEQSERDGLRTTLRSTQNTLHDLMMKLTPICSAAHAIAMADTFKTNDGMVVPTHLYKDLCDADMAARANGKLDSDAASAPRDPVPASKA